MKIKINNKFFSEFNSIKLESSLDTVASVFSISCRFNPFNQFHKEIFKPLSFNTIEMFSDNDVLLFTGTSVNTSLKSQRDRELQVLNGYSKCGIIEDCTIPLSSYPLEKNKVSLKNICEIILKDFSIGFNIDQSVLKEMDLIYSKTVATPTETVKSFLSKLAAQRNIIISHDSKGDLLFYRPNTSGIPKTLITDKNSLNMSLNVRGQAMHSKINVLRQPSKDNVSLSPVDTANNNLISINRPVTKILTSGTETDTKKAADNILCKELKNIVVNVNFDRIVDLQIGDIVEVINEEIYLYKNTKLIVSNVSISQDEKSENMSITLLLPESFTGEQPKNIF